MQCLFPGTAAHVLSETTHPPSLMRRNSSTGLLATKHVIHEACDIPQKHLVHETCCSTGAVTIAPRTMSWLAFYFELVC